MRRLLYTAAGLSAALLVAAPVSAQQPHGIVTGVITAAESGQPLEGARVAVEGTVLVALTPASGMYRRSMLVASPSLQLTSGLMDGADSRMVVMSARVMSARRLMTGAVRSPMTRSTRCEPRSRHDCPLSAAEYRVRGW